MKKMVVLGAGRVGSAIAADLKASGFQVLLTDYSEKQLKLVRQRFGDMQTRVVDVQDHQKLEETLQEYELVINAVPGHLGFQTLSAVIDQGKDVVDISFFPEDAFELNDKAREKGVTAVVDCGVAPGLSNILLGYHHQNMEVTDFECLVGGLPIEQEWPFAYKAPFSPIDVIEEYLRPARLKEHGQIVTKDALTELDHIDFDGIGTLEAFNTDGLRTLLTSYPEIPNMKEKTMRYPGHAEYIQVLKKTGFFDEHTVNMDDGSQVSPRELTSRLLDRVWKLDEDEKEMTLMQVKVKGNTEKGGSRIVTYTLYDEYHESTGVSSMARTTGYTCTAVANLLAEGMFEKKGIIAPEKVGENAQCFEYIMDHLKSREIEITKTEKSNQS